MNWISLYFFFGELDICVALHVFDAKMIQEAKDFLGTTKRNCNILLAVTDITPQQVVMISKNLFFFLFLFKKNLWRLKLFALRHDYLVCQILLFSEKKSKPIPFSNSVFLLFLRPIVEYALAYYHFVQHRIIKTVIL